MGAYGEDIPFFGEEVDCVIADSEEICRAAAVSALRRFCVDPNHVFEVESASAALEKISELQAQPRPVGSGALEGSMPILVLIDRHMVASLEFEQLGLPEVDSDVDDDSKESRFWQPPVSPTAAATARLPTKSPVAKAGLSTPFTSQVLSNNSTSNSPYCSAAASSSSSSASSSSSSASVSSSSSRCRDDLRRLGGPSKAGHCPAPPSVRLPFLICTSSRPESKAVIERELCHAFIPKTFPSERLHSCLQLCWKWWQEGGGFPKACYSRHRDGMQSTPSFAPTPSRSGQPFPSVSPSLSPTSMGSCRRVTGNAFHIPMDGEADHHDMGEGLRNSNDSNDSNNNTNNQTDSSSNHNNNISHNNNKNSKKYFRAEAVLMSGVSFICEFLDVPRTDPNGAQRSGPILNDLAAAILHELPKHMQADEIGYVFINFLSGQDGVSVAVTPWQWNDPLAKYLPEQAGGPAS
mmetsp:Transcript_36475/g.78935  ORF Transcript_36475/g.78935 Transcript_36475/m.78935 type:complete len:464 (+) Transcript_36475:86-1477(+)